MTIVAVRRGIAALTLGIAVAIAASCGQPKPPTLEGAAQSRAQFLPGPCAATPQPVPELKTARCGVLVVPQDRSNPGRRTVRLAVAVVPSETQPPSADPIVFLTGGPGGDAVADPPLPAGVDINHTRDLILLSQRGTHSSVPALTCPEVDEFFARRVGLPYDAPSTGDEFVRSVTQCHDRLAAGADLAAFNSTESARDLVDLRTTLGIATWNVYSHSYGTDLALMYMRLDREAIGSVTLDGVAPPSVTTPGWAWSSAREAFDNMTHACAAQPACQARYPDLDQTFTDLVAQLEKAPVTTTITGRGGSPTRVVLDGGTLLNWFVPLATHFSAEFPAAVEELAHNDPRRIAERWAAVWADPSRTGIVGWGLTLSVLCREWVPFESLDDQLAKARQAFPTFPESVRAHAPQLPFLRQACDAWNVPKAHEDVRDITESDVPTLVLSGSFDGQTGPQWGHYVAQHLSHAAEVTVPGAAHGVYATLCGATVIASFFDDPQHPDTGCVGAVQPPPFDIIPPLS